MQRFLKTGLVTCLAIIFSLVIYGCGGGGSSGPAAAPPPPPPTPTAVDLSGLHEDYMNTGPEMDYTISAGGNMDVADVNYACASGGDDCTVSVDADGEVTSTGGMVTATNNAAALAAITAARNAKVVADTKAAATKTTAIAAEAAQEVDAGLGGGGGADGTTAVTTYSMTIERSHDATTVKITDTAMAAEDDPKFMQTMDLDNGRTMHVRDNGEGVEEVVIVSTDIEVPKATAFAMVEGQALNARDLDDDVDADGDGTATNDYTALTVTNVAADGANLPKVMASAFTSNSIATLTFGGDDPADEDDEAYETAGTYNGAMGTYMCAGGTADCTVTLDAMGKLTAMSDGWVFIPDEGATSDVPDADYLSYGVWLKRTTKDGAVTYNEVDTFAMSSVAASGSVAGVTGSATYEGGATGVYVHQVRNPAGNIDTATSGHFTADVALTATFGQVPVSATDTTGTIAPNLLNTLSGTINNFMLSGHDEGPGWSLYLQGDIDTGTGAVADGDVGTAKDRGDDGSYTATFHGDVTADAAGVVPKPGSVVGEFDAVFSNGSVAGAFGARIED